MLMYSIYSHANFVKKSYDGCAMRVVFSKLQNCADFSDGDFKDGVSAFQHVGPETAKAREPYVTALEPHNIHKLEKMTEDCFV